MRNDLEKLQTLLKAIENEPMQQRFVIAAIEEGSLKVSSCHPSWDKQHKRDWLTAGYSVYNAII